MKLLNKHVFAALATLMIPMAAMAQTPMNSSSVPGYWLDSSGTVARSGTGLCWRTAEWTPAMAVEGCEGYVRPVAALTTPTKPVVAAPALVAAAPAPAVAPKPAPAVVAVVAPLPQKISYSGDALFAFDKAELKPEGRAMLDKLVQQLQGASYDAISAIGHTDRFGTSDYNQKLSQRRAQAVKDYLVSRNIQATRVNAEGRGETQPTTKAADCPGNKSVKTVACLQPDRRVDVEMTGTRTVTGSL